jgi:hypothetical protein
MIYSNLPDHRTLAVIAAFAVMLSGIDQTLMRQAKWD